MNAKILAGAAVLLLAASSAAQAQLVITLQDASIEQGQAGTVDVLIQSATADNLSLFGFEFRITTNSPNRLAFIDPQSDAQLTDGSYVLGTDSLDRINSFAVGAVSTSGVPADTFIGGDQTNSFGDVSVTPVPRLLARLNLTTATLLAPQVGDSFTVSLIQNNPPAARPTRHSSRTAASTT